MYIPKQPVLLSKIHCTNNNTKVLQETVTWAKGRKRALKHNDVIIINNSPVQLGCCSLPIAPAMPSSCPGAQGSHHAACHSPLSATQSQLAAGPLLQTSPQTWPAGPAAPPAAVG